MITNESQLANIGITKLGHQMLILEAIRKVDLSIYDSGSSKTSIINNNNNNNGASNHIKVFVEEDETDANNKEMSSSSSSDDTAPPSILLNPNKHNTEYGKGPDRALNALAGSGSYANNSYQSKVNSSYDSKPSKAKSGKKTPTVGGISLAIFEKNAPMKMDPFEEEKEEKKHERK
eukprot:294026_1